eukprot:5528716-Amphidinium_carterae.1
MVPSGLLALPIQSASLPSCTVDRICGSCVHLDLVHTPESPASATRALTLTGTDNPLLSLPTI